MKNKITVNSNTNENNDKEGKIIFFNWNYDKTNHFISTIHNYSINPNMILSFENGFKQ